MEGLGFYKKSNNILGWILFVIALVVYTLTMEKSASFWDCGEFIAGAFKLQVVHPPGAPFFNILGRFFTLFAFGDVTQVATMVNFMSALSTAFVSLFCFWSATAIGRKLLLKSEADYSAGNIIAVLGAGFVAGLVCTFADSLWFSAAEGEVYALSMFFMTFVVWAALKWDADDSPNADRWLVLIAFMIGLSTGVHLLSMLVIPFVCLIVYFKKFKTNLVGFAAAFGLSFILIGVVMKVIIAGIPAIYAKTDLFFVNSLGLGFNSGVIFATVAIITALLLANFFAYKKQNELAQKVFFGLTVLLIGYSTFLLVPIRSEANTPINMNRPTDPFSMLSYLNREQYGERPLLFGPAYNVDQYDIKREPNGQVVKKGLRPKWSKGETQYDNIGEKFDYTFENKDMMFFPRLGIWNDPAKIEAYRVLINPAFNIYDRENKKNITKFPAGQLESAEQYARQMNAQNESKYGSQRYTVKDEISMTDNIKFFINYQFGYMYMRYFMWNFSGRQNDLQGRYDNSEGGWITGINFIDNNLTLWGNPSWPQDNLSPIKKANKANNKFYAIPFILGLIGLYFLFAKDFKMGIAVMLMFLTTGIIFTIYGNHPPVEPRERDYAIVGSIFTYSIWIGLSVLVIFKALSKIINPKVASAAALSLGLIPAILMGSDGWDDHNRDGRTTTVDFARNYLESCLPNAVIFTQGDNDTYPLWYAQEVEGIRTDVRVVNLSLLGVDWYVNQLRYKTNDAAPLKLTFTPDMIRGNNRDYVRYMQNPKLDASKFYNAQSIMQFVAIDDPAIKQQIDDPYYLPSKKLSFPVDVNTVKSQNMVPSNKFDQIVPELEIELNKANLMKNDLMTVDIIANNINERPIYFAVSVSPSAYLGFQKYFIQEGLTYRVVPLLNPSGSPQNSPVRLDLMYENMMTKFRWGQIDNNPNIYLDENILRMTLNLVSNFSKLATELALSGDCEKAVQVADKCFEAMPTDRVPYNYFHSDFPKIYLSCNNTVKAKEIADAMLATGKGELDYYVYVFQNIVKRVKKTNPTYLEELSRGAFTQKRDVTEYLYIMQQLSGTFKDSDPEYAKKFDEFVEEYSVKLRNVNI